MHSELSLIANSTNINTVGYFDIHKNPETTNLYEKTLHTFCKSSSNLAVMYLDIDNFRNVNILLGRDLGDDVLIHIAQTILHCGVQIVARVGGDKFAVFTKGSKDEIEEMAYTIYHELNTPFFINNRSIILSASIGIASYLGMLGQCMQNAEIAMFEAKKKGLKKALFFNHEISIKAVRYAEILYTLNNCHTNNELYLLYQPESNLQTGRVVALESLMRLYNDKYGMVSPSEFIPIAESNHIISQLGYWTIEKVCDFIQTLQNDHVSFGMISINISPIQLVEPDFVQNFHRIITAKNIEPQYLQIEITESSLANSIAAIIEPLTRLKQIGVSIALDDFGSTYSSLNYLAYLPVDIIKIDKTFIDDIHKNEKKQLIVKALIDLSHSLGYKVVAEGIETNEIRDLLIDLHCDIMQGYLLSPPLHQNAVKSLLLQTNP